ncbi:hypothetical protein APHAL10511_006700 [Amanita phalloides]|nr:hypothetical protein APHAL10511_006700 [Amanita phalloides]
MASSVSLTILTTNATSILAAPPTLTPTNNIEPSSGSSGNARSVSYFFGFLIAIVAVLLFFVGCGIGARRGLLRRRRLLPSGHDEETGNFFANVDIERMLGRVSPPKEPSLWETTFEKGAGQWESIMPLSVAVVPEGHNTISSPPSPMSLPMPNWLRPRQPMRRSPSWSNTMHTALPQWITRFSRRPSRQTTSGLPLGAISQIPSEHSIPPSSPPNSSLAPTSDGKGDLPDLADSPPKMPPEYQVVVMISMPSKHAREEGLLGDVQFGVTKLPVPWDSKDSS